MYRGNEIGTPGGFVDAISFFCHLCSLLSIERHRGEGGCLQVLLDSLPWVRKFPLYFKAPYTVRLGPFHLVRSARTMHCVPTAFRPWTNTGFKTRAAEQTHFSRRFQNERMTSPSLSSVQTTLPCARLQAPQGTNLASPDQRMDGAEDMPIWRGHFTSTTYKLHATALY